MRTERKQYSVKLNSQTGDKVVANGQQLLVTTNGRNIWVPTAVKATGKFIDYQINEVGDTFVASKNSTRTKGEVMGDKCPAGKEDEPLYLEGEVVTRTSESVVFVGFSDDAAIAVEATLEERFAMAAKYGVTIKM